MELTLCMAVYGQPEMLAKQIATVERYPESIRDNLTVVIVDDHGDPAVSKESAVELALHVDSVKLFRVDRNIPWNQMGARNLAMFHSKGWCLMIDPDMVFRPSIMERMFQAAEKLKRGRVVKYGLRHKTDGRIDMTSPNTYLIHRDDFFAVGGYDEDYAGNKGWSDVQLLDVLEACYKIEKRPDLHAEFYSTEQIPDAMVTTLDRSVAANRKKRVKKRDQSRSLRGWAKFARKQVDATRLRFPWTQVF
ncbi:MAG: glycosyltransferase family 2 protein [bacterium]|nr:glycosyltransferase family 2 protein [bacterium]